MTQWRINSGVTSCHSTQAWLAQVTVHCMYMIVERSSSSSWLVSFFFFIVSGDIKHGSKVWFYQLGLGASNTVNDFGWKLETLGSIVTKLGHSDVSGLEFVCTLCRDVMCIWFVSNSVWLTSSNSTSSPTSGRASRRWCAKAWWRQCANSCSRCTHRKCSWLEGRVRARTTPTCTPRCTCLRSTASGAFTSTTTTWVSSSRHDQENTAPAAMKSPTSTSTSSNCPHDDVTLVNLDKVLLSFSLFGFTWPLCLVLVLI